MKNKICMIVCWFGKLPYYYDLWEKTCSNNPEVDFYIFTDQDYKSAYNNIKFIKMNLKEINKLFSESLRLNINIDMPYKLCDFKPAYGLLFNDYIKEYNYWGHCDMDQIFGKITDFVNDEILNNYERVNHLGHFSLYKNNNKMNNLFKKSGAKFSYKEVYTSKEHYAFDEMTGINMIATCNNIKSYEIEDFADIDVKHKRYLIDGKKNYKNQFFELINGKLYYNYYENSWKRKEIMYLHFQKKKPIIEINNYDQKIGIGYKRITDSKYSFEINGNRNFIYERIEIIEYYVNKVIDFIKCNKEKKKIWIKQKI